jgi:hypothetical protein
MPFDRKSSKKNKTTCVIYDGSYVETSSLADRSSEKVAARYRKIDAAIRMHLEQHWKLPPGGCGINDARYFIAPHRLIRIDPKAKLWDVIQTITLPDPRNHDTETLDPFSDYTVAREDFTVELARLESAGYDALVLVSSNPVFFPLLKSVRSKGALTVLVDLQGEVPNHPQYPDELIEQADVVLKLGIWNQVVGQRAVPPRLNHPESAGAGPRPPSGFVAGGQNELRDNRKCWKKPLIEAARQCDAMMKRDLKKEIEHPRLYYCKIFLNTWYIEGKRDYTPEKLANLIAKSQMKL